MCMCAPVVRGCMCANHACVCVLVSFVESYAAGLILCSNMVELCTHVMRAVAHMRSASLNVVACVLVCACAWIYTWVYPACSNGL
jgi:hypothetical protein